MSNLCRITKSLYVAKLPSYKSKHDIKRLCNRTHIQWKRLGLLTNYSPIDWWNSFFLFKEKFIASLFCCNETHFWNNQSTVKFLTLEINVKFVSAPAKDFRYLSPLTIDFCGCTMPFGEWRDQAGFRSTEIITFRFNLRDATMNPRVITVIAPKNSLKTETI